MECEDIHRIPADIHQRDAAVILQLRIIPAQRRMTLREHLALGDAASVRRSLEQERNIVTQKISPKCLLLRPVAANGQAHAKGDFRACGSRVLHRIRDCRQRKHKGIRLSGLVLLKTHAALADGVISALVEELHIRRDEFLVACSVSGGIEHPLRGFGVVVSVVHTKLNH
jgi:hypothetical protein